MLGLIIFIMSWFLCGLLSILYLNYTDKQDITLEGFLFIILLFFLGYITLGIIVYLSYIENKDTVIFKRKKK